MRLLHTADWHLGHRLYDRRRTAEHRRFLDWLLATVRERAVDVLIVAGDVFDTMNPANEATTLYYDFLGRLRDTGCRAAIIVGGNHDSPSLLDAPRAVLSHMAVHVVGAARPAVADRLITVADAAGAPALHVAAVPFLRDRDLQASGAGGETAGDRVGRIQAAIRNHYAEIADHLNAHPPAAPVVATGHLYASGSADADDRRSNIYLADRNNIRPGDFPDVFDYVALGHIHQPQRVGSSDRIRYCGSPVPLTFGEARRAPTVCLVELDGAGLPPRVEQLAVPVSRPLIRVRGEVDEVRRGLRDLVAEQRRKRPTGLRPWLEVRIVTPHHIPQLSEELLALLAPTEREKEAREGYLPRLLALRTERPAGSATPAEGEPADDAPAEELGELRPEEVFRRLCHGSATEEERADYPELLASFRELRNWMEDESALAE